MSGKGSFITVPEQHDALGAPRVWGTVRPVTRAGRIAIPFVLFALMTLAKVQGHSLPDGLLLLGAVQERNKLYMSTSRPTSIERIFFVERPTEPVLRALQYSAAELEERTRQMMLATNIVERGW